MKPNYFCKIIFSICLFAGLIVSCQKVDDISAKNISKVSELPATSANPNVNDHNIPVDAVFFNDCCGEYVHVYGTAHFVMSPSVIHYEVRNITGTGLSSNLVYTGQGPSIQTIPYYNNQYDGHLTSRLSLNATGCGFRLNVLLHITVNTNGDVTSNIERVETKCD